MGYRPIEYAHIVVGAGAMGSATAYSLSKRRGRTLVLERFHENHAFGSSHGRTRILRTAYAEGASYVPLVLRARRLWNHLGKVSGREIFRPTGALLAARSDSVSLNSARRSAERWNLPHDLWDSGPAQQRFPAFRFGADDRALWDPQGGVVFPEKAIGAFRRLSHDLGTSFRWNSPVSSWQARPDGRLWVRTAAREYIADRLVLTAGAWMPTLVPGVNVRLRVEQQTVYWFRPARADRPSFHGMPAFVWYNAEGGYYYGTPDFGDGVKVGGCEGQWVRNLSRRPEPSVRELRSIQGFRAQHLPRLDPTVRRQATCLYTNTPDKNFIVDFHPDSRDVMIVSACSGHGFKFASAIGELVAEGIDSGSFSPLLEPFRLRT